MLAIGCPWIASRLPRWHSIALPALRRGASRRPTKERRLLVVLGVNLTPREREVLGLLCQHLTNAQMASGLFISERTIENHVRRILRKLGARHRREAATIAARFGLVSFP